MTAEIVKLRRSRKDHAKIINADWTKGVAAVVTTGRDLITAKDELEHGEWLDMVNEDLPFTDRTAARLMAIARHQILSNKTHESYLPPSWMTLYELTRLPEGILIKALKDGRINAQTERKDIKLMMPLGPAKQQPDIAKFVIIIINSLDKLPSDKLVEKIKSLVKHQGDLSGVARINLKRALKNVSDRFIELAGRIK
jgi:hypothetical protein